MNNDIHTLYDIERATGSYTFNIKVTKYANMKNGNYIPQEIRNVFTKPLSKDPRTISIPLIKQYNSKTGKPSQTEYIIKT